MNPSFACTRPLPLLFAIKLLSLPPQHQRIFSIKNTQPELRMKNRCSNLLRHKLHFSTRICENRASVFTKKTLPRREILYKVCVALIIIKGNMSNCNGFLTKIVIPFLQQQNNHFLFYSKKSGEFSFPGFLTSHISFSSSQCYYAFLPLSHIFRKVD